MKNYRSLFVSHGAPTYALEPGQSAAQLTALGERMHRPKAIALVSPHWMTHGVKVSAVSAPKTIYDFGGFPDALRSIQYPANGDPLLAEQIVEKLRALSWSAELDTHWGLDHGAWVPLRYLFPKADIPVLQISMPHDLTNESAWKLGQDLSDLAIDNVLLIGSGSLTHNLYEFGQFGEQVQPYVTAFVDWIRCQLNAMQSKSSPVNELLDWEKNAPFAQRAHPSNDHFLPLLIAAGAWSKRAEKSNEPLSHEVLDGGVRYGMLSMESYAFN